MESLDTLPTLAAYLACGMAVQTASGFGANLVVLTLAWGMMSLGDLLSVLTPLNMAQSLIVLARSREDTPWAVVSRRIVPVMGVGCVVGFVFARLIDSGPLGILLGVFIVAVSLATPVALVRGELPTGRGTWRTSVGVGGSGPSPGVTAAGWPITGCGPGNSSSPPDPLSAA